MNKNKKYRKLKHLICKYDIYYFPGDFNNFLERLDYLIFLKEKNYKPFTEIKKLILELEITSGEYYKILSEERKRKNTEKEKNKLNTLKETRDNKGVYVGGGGSNHHSVRYPKKNRSKKVWDIFYKMFPWYAKKDNYKFKK